MVTDPVCGMRIDEKSAAANADHEGQHYAFCSTGCRDRFVANPATYVKPATAAAADVIYRCPMHPEVQQNTPGKCPKCGMALQPDAPTGVANLSDGHTAASAAAVEDSAQHAAAASLGHSHSHHAPASAAPSAGAVAGARYTCPMHPEIVRDKPGECPICGMALVPIAGSGAADDSELRDLQRRLWIGAALSIPLFILAMAPMVGLHAPFGLQPRATGWIEFVLGTPVVLWVGWPILRKFWLSLTHHSLNMYTLIGLGVGLAYLFSLAAVLAPGLFPPEFR
ncbi:MAG: heavy metal-binding domain-containing protein, partial [Betaproteobacteria bacterium]